MTDATKALAAHLMLGALLIGATAACAGNKVQHTGTSGGQQNAAGAAKYHCGYGRLPNCPGQTYCDRLPQPWSCRGNGPAGATQPTCKGPHKGPNGVMIQCD